MTYIYNKVERFVKWSLWLCLLALLPVQVYGFSEKYGILWEDDNPDNTWRVRFSNNVSDYFSGDFAKGSGTVSNPYLIETVWDLCRLQYKVNEKKQDFKGKYFKLVNDIDLNGYMWYPIGVEEGTNREGTFFGGYFDGNGKTVKNMKMTLVNWQLTSKYSYGLFGKVRGAIRNLNMTGAQITMNVNTQETSDSRSLSAGLLCGDLLHDYDNNIYGGIYGCHVQGKIEGWMKNEQNDYRSSYVGGVVGYCDNPASIYKCQADVTMNLTDVYYIGGIVGYSTAVTTLPDSWFNLENDEACVSYIFDCVANVNITATITNAPANHCGGICGASYHNILACAATGTISSVPASGKSAYIGGLAGTNGYNIMGCVSMVRLQGGTKVGGLIGDNSNKITDLIKGHVLNCVYSSHIDSPNAEAVHGLLGTHAENANKPVNCLFLGTMRPSTSKAQTPLSSGDTENCYADVNLYDDDDTDNDTYRLTSGLTSALPAFTPKINYYNYWDSKVRNREEYIEISASSDWEHVDGFYPRLKIGFDNIANATENNKNQENNVIDFVIDRAARAFGDDVSAIRTPSLLQDYAWLASVPAFTHDGQLAYYLDTSISLADKIQRIDQSTQNVAHYSLPTDQTVMVVSGSTATPKEKAKGDVMLTITSADNISKQLLLNVNNSRTWDEKVASSYDRGDGTAGNPYEIHNARQLIRAFISNEKDKHYKLVNDIWFNENLLTNTGEPKEGCSKWDHLSKREENNWKAHLDGDGHLVHGLFSTNAFGLIEKIHNDASIVNTGFVDCLTWSPETEDYKSGFGNPFAFLSPEIGGTASVRNCLFDGVVKDRRNTDAGIENNFCAFIHKMDVSEKQVNEPVVEDCVVSVVAKSIKADEVPVNALFAFKTELNNHKTSARRILVLNNSHATSKLTNTSFTLEECHWPKGYLPSDEGTAPNDMTDGKFFTGEGFDKWTAKEGRFPMLTTFAGTAYGKLISLPIYTDKDNRFDNMNYLLDFMPGTADWQVTDNSVIAVHKDIRVLEPRKTSNSVYLVRSLDEAKVITPIMTDASITAGIKFEDKEAKNFCVAHYDKDGDGEVSLSELKGVSLDDFQTDMDEYDGNPNDGDDIKLFPEFRYFSGVTALGTSFQEKEKLQSLAFSDNIKAIPDDAFKGNEAMTSFTIPASVTTFGSHPFFGSGLQNYYVEPDNPTYTATDGLLFNKDEDGNVQLLSYPNGRKGTSVTVPDNVKTIADYAIYMMPEVDTVYIAAADYDYETVVNLTQNSIKAGKKIKIFIEDGTQELGDSDDDDDSSAPAFFASRRVGTESDAEKPQTKDGRGEGALLNKYKDRYKNYEEWDVSDFDRYVDIDISANSKDADGYYWATLYCGFDTQLPDFMTPYIADKGKTGDNKTTLKLRRISNQLRMLTPVVIRSTKSGQFKLLPSNDNYRYKRIPVHDNLLDGVTRKGLDPHGQESSNQGGLLTLGRNKSGKVGFFLYKGTTNVPPYRAYISVNTVQYSPSLLLSIDDEEDTTSINEELSMENEESAGAWYDLKGQRVEHPTKGIYIHNGRKVVIK